MIIRFIKSRWFKVNTMIKSGIAILFLAIANIVTDYNGVAITSIKDHLSISPVWFTGAMAVGGLLIIFDGVFLWYNLTNWMRALCVIPVTVYVFSLLFAAFYEDNTLIVAIPLYFLAIVYIHESASTGGRYGRI